MTKNAIGFDIFLLCAIDESLNFLGESVRQSVYFYMENKFEVPRDKIPENSLSFKEGWKKSSVRALSS